ncbi:MAG TPA: hypothetical protein VF392_01205 [Terracidiphilus sp.]
MRRFAVPLYAPFVLLLALAVMPAFGQPPARFLGTVMTLNGNHLTVRTDNGQAYDVQVASTTAIKRIEPGQKDLSTAQDMTLADVAVGDRVLVKVDPNSTATPPEAVQIIAVKQSDVVKLHLKEREDWQLHSVGGLVKSVDPVAGVIVVSSGAGPTLKTITIHTSPTTIIRRYAKDSVRYADATPAPLTAIVVGDQLRARGKHNEANTEMTADEVVSGTFRNVSGLITAVDATAGTFEVKDLISKKAVTIHIEPNTQMRRLPEQMARFLSMRLKETAPTASPAGEHMRGQGGPADLQMLLNHTPAITLQDLKKGDAVMLVSTAGDNDVNAITLLAGIELLLEAPEASRNLLSSWSMGTGGADAGAN